MNNKRSSSSSSSSTSSEPSVKKYKKASSSNSNSSDDDGRHTPEFKEDSEISFGVDSTSIPGLAKHIRLREFQLDDANKVVNGWVFLDNEEKNAFQMKAKTKGQVQKTKGVVCAHEMGLGKTLIALAALAIDMTEVKRLFKSLTTPPKIQVLIVLPNTVLWNWETEIAKFFPKNDAACPFKNVLVYHSSNKDIKLPTTSAGLLHYDAVLTTFGTFESRFDIFNTLEWEYLCVDEAHHLRNKSTQVRFKIVCTLIDL